MNGAGEMLVFSAADFEDFREPRPDLPPIMEEELDRWSASWRENRWPFRLHATYDESIARFLDVFEAVNRDVPFTGLRLVLRPRRDHHAAQPRAGQGPRRRHRHPAPDGLPGRVLPGPVREGGGRATPPIRRMLEMGIPVGAGTDATRVASYNPWVSLYWLVTGRTVGGALLYPEANRLDREQALRLYTIGSSWFSGEEGKKGILSPGQLADLAVLSADYFTIPEEEIKGIESVLTIVGGRWYTARRNSAASRLPLCR